jgi:hypothetical protein
MQETTARREHCDSKQNRSHALFHVIPLKSPPWHVVAHRGTVNTHMFRMGWIEIDPFGASFYNSPPPVAQCLPACGDGDASAPAAAGSVAMLCSSASYNRNLWQIRQNPEMKSILPTFAVLAALTPLPSVSAQQPAASAGEALVDRVTASVEGQPSIAAKIRHRVELSGRALIGTGIYLQQGRGAARSFRLELKLRTALFATSLQQVCDGTHLWILEDLEGSKSFSSVDMARLQRAQPKSQRPSEPQPLAAIAGLAQLLAGLQGNFLFGRVVENQLDDLAVWSIEGAWEPAKLAQLLPEQQEKINSGASVDLSPLAPNLPHRVVLHVGSDDLFPYRIEYWRREQADNDEAGSTREMLMVVMEFYEVQLGGRLDPALFAFRPEKNATPIDRTQEFLDRLGLEDPPPEEARRRLRSPL